MAVAELNPAGVPAALAALDRALQTSIKWNLAISQQPNLPVVAVKAELARNAISAAATAALVPDKKLQPVAQQLRA